MQRQVFTFYVEPLGFDVDVIALSERQAHNLAWKNLTDEQRDQVASLELIDVHEVAA
jgi:hypothetical protein